MRELIAAGTVTAETLVWTEGMANWQRAGEIPGLLRGRRGPPAMPRPGGLPASAGGYGGGPLSIDLGLWDFTWRSLTLLLGLAFIIPTPWVDRDVLPVDRFLRARSGAAEPDIHRPARDADVVFRGSGRHHRAWLASMRASLNIRHRASFSWCCTGCSIRWFVANISSNGQPLGLRFSGSFWGYLGWNLLAFVSVITIIGWAWVYTAQIRWMCRHIEGTRREVVFNATGLEFLWRSVVTLHRLRLHHPDSLGDALVHPLAGVASRTGRANGCTPTPERVHLRWRSEPSCATEATSVPSCLKIMPRVRPRPPCALGESCA